MASVFHLYCDAFNIKKRVVRKYQDLAESDKKIYFAAVAIQRRWRGYVVRKMIEKWNKAATIIQKYVRGWLVRIHLPEYLKEYYYNLSVKYYNEQATKIQALWRGFVARKTYKDVKALLAERNELEWVSKGMQDQIRKLFEELRAGLWNETRQNVEKTLTVLFERHHLLRTMMLEGIFSIHGELSCIEKILKSMPLTGYMRRLRALLYKDSFAVERSKEKKPQVLDETHCCFIQ